MRLARIQLFFFIPTFFFWSFTPSPFFLLANLFFFCQDDWHKVQFRCSSHIPFFSPRFIICNYNYSFTTSTTSIFVCYILFFFFGYTSYIISDASIPFSFFSSLIFSCLDDLGGEVAKGGGTNCNFFFFFKQKTKDRNTGVFFPFFILLFPIFFFFFAWSKQKKKRSFLTRRERDGA